MAKQPAEDLPTFLARQAHGDLVAVLLELAQDHEVVLARLARMQLADQPDKLASGFKKMSSTRVSNNAQPPRSTFKVQLAAARILSNIMKSKMYFEMCVRFRCHLSWPLSVDIDCFRSNLSHS